MNPEVPTNVLDYCAPSTRGILADITKGGDPITMARFAATMLDQINPAMVVIANKYGHTAPIVLTQVLRSMVSEVVSDTWKGPRNGQKSEAVDAFDRPLHFTLFCPDTASLTMAIARVCLVVPNVTVEDDRDGSSGCHKLSFTANGLEVITELQTLSTGHSIDIQMAVVKD